MTDKGKKKDSRKRVTIEAKDGRWVSLRSLMEATAGGRVLVAFPAADMKPNSIDWRECRVLQDCRKNGSVVTVETVNGGIISISAPKSLMKWVENEQ